MNKKRIVFIVVVLLIFRFLVYNYFPIKIARNTQLMDTNEVISLNNEMKQIYAYCDKDKGWLMIGYDGLKFDRDQNEYPQIAIKGKFPDNINEEISSSTIFILNGYYTGKNIMDYNYNAKEFYVENYDMLKKYNKSGSNNQFNKFLSLSDLGANHFNFKISYVGDNQNI